MIREHLWRLLALLAGTLGVVTLGIGFHAYLSGHRDQAAQWAMAFGGLALVSFTAVQLEIQQRHEDERRTDQQRRELEHRERIDFRISAITYAVVRQLTAGIDEADPSLKKLVEIEEDVLTRDIAQTQQMLLRIGGPWARGWTARELDRAERRIEDIVALAPEASGPIAGAVRAGAIAFYEATRAINRQAKAETGNQIGVERSAEEIVQAYRGIERSIDLLSAAIGPELRLERSEHVAVGPVEEERPDRRSDDRAGG